MKMIAQKKCRNETFGAKASNVSAAQSSILAVVLWRTALFPAFWSKLPSFRAQRPTFVVQKE